MSSVGKKSDTKTNEKEKACLNERKKKLLKVAGGSVSAKISLNTLSDEWKNIG